MDFGGVVLDVIVRHEVYGELRAELNISSRNKVALFMEENPAGKITAAEEYHIRGTFSYCIGRLCADPGSD